MLTEVEVHVNEPLEVYDIDDVTPEWEPYTPKRWYKTLFIQTTTQTTPAYKRVAVGILLGLMLMMLI